MKQAIKLLQLIFLIVCCFCSKAFFKVSETQGFIPNKGQFWEIKEGKGIWQTYWQ